MGNKKKSILHIEDDADYQDYMAALLDDVADVASVFTGDELRQLLVGTTFDLFILDLILKGTPGSTLARELRASYPNTPIVIVSAYDMAYAIDESDATFIKGKLKEKDFISTIKKLMR